MVACGGTPEISDGETSSGGSTGKTSTGGRGGNSGGVTVPVAGQGGETTTEKPSVCGNGTVESKEICDDGNTVGEDGCSADCAKQDPRYACTAGKACVQWMICGNGVIEGEERCDDGNTDSGDGCTSSCDAVETGFGCARPGKPCVELPSCGNGVRERGEDCDDGQGTPTSGDGCSDKCELEAGYLCFIPGQACVREVCGDGNRTPKEQCDDKNQANGDGCSSTCQVEVGYRCSEQGCATICGDGKLSGSETCDDGGLSTGDGCSAACRIEPFFTCQGTPSQCASTIVCGNSVREPGEVCDPPNEKGCLPGCKSFSPDVAIPSECGNGVIEFDESCDPPAVGKGCSASCDAEPGYTCPRPSECFLVPRCGDGRVNPGEGCDDGNAVAGDGCSQCTVDSNYVCTGLEPSLCLREVCGDGLRTASEQCDDGPGGAAGDGCSACKTDPGWVCPKQGEPCRPRCGDGTIVGTEACDDGNLVNGDGCTATCRVEPGFTCPAPKQACIPSACGNTKKEAGESCDDGNKIAGDGCGPTCQAEPKITPGPNPVVAVACGDGLITGTEACDDGNTNAGDGCSAACAVEDGFKCTNLLDPPTFVDFKVTYRDFKSGNALTPGGHPDFQYKHLNHVPGIAGAACTRSNQATCGRLDANGKPALVVNNQATTGIASSATYGLWFRDTNPGNVTGANGAIQITPFTRALRLSQTATGSDVYTFDASGAFYPILGNEGFGNIGTEVNLCNDGAGVTNTTGSPACDTCDATCKARNYGFTTELRYFFQYSGGETLTFRGDDDVWVFINGRLAVDIGGLHSQKYGRVVLGDDGGTGAVDSDCSVHSADNLPTSDIATCYTTSERSDTKDDRFGLTAGNIYEIVLFHAERHTSASNFLLTLAGFLAPRSDCNPICGDGILVNGEVCDDGAKNQDGVTNICNKSCTMRAFCGDKQVQQGEQCDNGTNMDLYVAAPSSGACAPGCLTPPHCGDGVPQSTEQCDKGLANNDNGYGAQSCTTACKLGAYCGDGKTNGAELCDDGAENGRTYGPDSCGLDCQPGPTCGDGTRNGPEECDEGPTGGATCDATCHFVARCGDGLVSSTESCDFGPFASNDYGGCTSTCAWGPRCGDGNTNLPYEECDLGADKNTGLYGGCSSTCTYAPRCGDARVQAEQAEQCDNGFNQDTYAYYAEACGPGCKRPEYCGDSRVAKGYELCDDGANNNDAAYDGCTTKCDWGPYCGDNHVDAQGGETCDNGLENALYGDNSSACGFDCQPAPFCGDGERNGPEQCDLGADKNDGSYGACNADCTWAPRCGDSVTQGSESCDDGPTGSLRCDALCRRRDILQ